MEYVADWRTEVLVSSSSVIWLAFVIATQISGGWARKLRWLWLLFPVAFGPQLFLLYFFIVVALFGFAP
jgi:hypothetical protein